MGGLKARFHKTLGHLTPFDSQWTIRRKICMAMSGWVGDYMGGWLYYNIASSRYSPFFLLLIIMSL